MKTPLFWYQEEKFSDWLIPRLLTPLSWVYGFMAKELSKRSHPYRVPVLVICVGNIVAGGAGKTPTVIALAKMLHAMGKQPHVISRGYGASIKKCTKVDINLHDATQVGDEPLLIAKKDIPCWIGPNRRKSAFQAVQDGADVILMDDGHQNQDLIKDFSIVVIDGLVGFGNGKLIPAGPLRENEKNGIERADALFLIGDDLTGIENSYKNKLLFKADFVPIENTLENKRIFGFAGLGRPEKFLRTLYLMGAEIAGFHSFPDHYNYKTIDLKEILRVALRLGATTVTTRKDFMRVPKEFQDQITVIDVELSIYNDDLLKKTLHKILEEKNNVKKN